MSVLISWRRPDRFLRLLCALALLCLCHAATASEHRGQVSFNGLPVPGVTVTATQGTRTFVTVSDQQGLYDFADLPDGTWKIDLRMTGFAPLAQDVTVTPNMPAIGWELKMLPLDTILAQTRVVKAEAPVTAAAAAPAEKAAPKAAETEEAPRQEESAQSSDGFLVNGSVNNAATSQFTLAPGFGNTRKGLRGLYTGGLGVILDNSALDARPYSLTGLNLPTPAYNKVTGTFTFGGPINIRRLMPRGPTFFVGYQWTRDRIASTDAGLVPTDAERAGILPTGTVAVSPQARALLALYPEPNISDNAMYNYEVPILNNTHQDGLQTRLEKTISRRDQVYGGVAAQSTRSDNSNLFAFRDTTDTLGLNSYVNWSHRFNHNLFSNAGFRFSRSRVNVTPYFENRKNISGNAGIVANTDLQGPGNDQDPTNWGPPTLIFSSGIASLSDAQSAFNRNRSDGVSLSAQWYRQRHNFTFGGDFRRQEYNYFSQQDPRGTFTFTGNATNVSDLADFLTGVPDASEIAFGNPDKYLRQSVYDAYFTDDWRLRPELTINAGVRWEYGAPISELKNRLANLDIAPGFTNAQPVVATSPTGPLTGQHYPTSLLRPDRMGIEPRIGLSWRPIPGSSMVVRAGYGVYDDTSVYQATALAMAQQAPLSKSLSVQNSAACPLTLANGFIPCATTTQDTFAVDPNFRVGYAQTWQLSVQRDLPAALQVTATYLGVKGTRGVQEFLPNTYPLSAADPCPACPVGFVYRTSNGDSTREAGSLQLRRRLRSGLTATALYTYSKSIDDDSTLGGQGPVAAGATSQSTGSAQIAQDWRNLRAERALSTFDQRHLLTASMQYTTGMGLGGGTLMTGWRGRAYKEWTVLAQVVAGSGLPETPVLLAPVNGTGFTGPLRPDRTSVPLSGITPGHFLDAAAYASPQPGAWGDAGRDSITGPNQLTFNASLARTFRVGKRYNLDVRVDSTNLLNHVVFTSWNTTLSPAPCSLNTPSTCGTTTPTLASTSPIFGLPTAAGAMRSLQTTARLRF